ncbi:hypothetical protein [Spiroplasma citri]|nr:hypothetical protein [Spiroplasma citri]QIA67976.1 hypothetical protein GMI18_10510 [Spiroplasma citri]
MFTGDRNKHTKNSSKKSNKGEYIKNMKKINETIKSKIISILNKNDISIKDFDNFWEKTKTLVNIKNKLRGVNSAVEEWERKKSNPIKYYGTFGFNSLNEAYSYQMKYIKL